MTICRWCVFLQATGFRNPWMTVHEPTEYYVFNHTVYTVKYDLWTSIRLSFFFLILDKRKKMPVSTIFRNLRHVVYLLVISPLTTYYNILQHITLPWLIDLLLFWTNCDCSGFSQVYFLCFSEALLANYKPDLFFCTGATKLRL